LNWGEWALAFALFCTLLQMAYWSLVFARLAFYQPPKRKLEPEESLPPVSIVICARNEAENLKKNLDRFLNQNYPSFEIVVVNDCSSDDSEQVILQIQKEYPNLRLLSVEEAHPPGKKFALTKGIEAAQHEILLLSDADCFPASPNWIRHMQAALRGKKQIALGFSPYTSSKSILNIFIRFEAIHTAIQYFSFALVHFPYMGVGRNLSYLRALYVQAGGFVAHQAIASGDDDLFINEIATGENTEVIHDPESFVFSTPKTTWEGFYYQKSRHLTTGTRYRWQHQLLLGGLSASHFGHYLGIFALLMLGGWRAALIIYLARMLVVALLSWRILRLFQALELWKWLPFFDFSLFIYYWVFAPKLIFGNPRTWKQ
jgi:poly-beta-1,6-N-acetyl-D-glucosamine synthase